ncbi:Bug family tripartite tricarboxylate transporter substrate binding protein [Bordetella muralis]|uniref:Bug family tripartite tricarboxylate transporter substrate binding protein n=1 Tax=Bordetella muralis TaxID=1649130 RepID=UPI0039F05EA9
MKKLLHLCAAIFSASAITATAAAAQDYPDQPVTIIVPYAPGGVTDVYGRVIADYLGRQWKVPVIVKNEAGGGTMIGTSAAARAAPDGNTILLTSYAYTSNPILRTDLSYDQNALRPVMLLGNSRNMLVVSARSDLHTLADVVAKAKKSPGNLRLASSGIASSPHIAAELWAREVGVQITHVPYRGTSPAMNDVFAGEVDGIFDGPSAMPNVKAGKLRAIAIASENPHPFAPGVPTFRELGIDLVFGSWFGFLVPKDTPDAIVDKINADLRRAVEDPTVKAAIDKTGLLLSAGSPQQFSDFLNYESERLQKLAKTSADLRLQ